MEYIFTSMDHRYRWLDQLTEEQTKRMLPYKDDPDWLSEVFENRSDYFEWHQDRFMGKPFQGYTTGPAIHWCDRVLRWMRPVSPIAGEVSYIVEDFASTDGTIFVTDHMQSSNEPDDYDQVRSRYEEIKTRLDEREIHNAYREAYGHHCGHEHDCCGCVFYSGCVVYRCTFDTDDELKRYIVKLNYGRNL